jgi:DNA replication and repair protein RecF
VAAVPPATIASLSLRDFRNFERLDLELSTTGLALVGENGHGKTNLLEAIYYLSLFRSIRGARDVDLVRFGCDAFFVEGIVRTPAEHALSVGFERASRRKRVRQDGGVVARLSDAFGALPVVMFAPTDVQLVAGGPAERRRFLDIMLALSSRGYLEALQSYRGALSRRNAALKDAAKRGRTNMSAISVWEEPLARHGAQLGRARNDWVQHVTAAFALRSTELGESGRSELRYVSGQAARTSLTRTRCGPRSNRDANRMHASASRNAGRIATISSCCWTTTICARSDPRGNSERPRSPCARSKRKR